MSNRSLIEINHDKVHAIEADPAGFVRALVTYLNSGSPREAAPMGHFGATVFGMRHHSDPFRIQWGGHTIEEGRPPLVTRNPAPDAAPPSAPIGVVGSFKIGR